MIFEYRHPVVSIAMLYSISIASSSSRSASSYFLFSFLHSSAFGTPALSNSLLQFEK